MKNAKLRTLVTGGLTLTIIPLIVLILLLLGYTVRENESYRRDLMMKNQEAVLSSLSSAVSDIRNQTNDILRSSDWLFYTNSSSANRISSYGDNLIDSFRNRLSPHSEFAGVILYHQKSGRFIRHFSSPSYTDCLEYIEEYLTDFDSPRASIEEVIPVFENSMLLYRISQRYGCVGILVDPAENRVYHSLLPTLEEGTRCEFSSAEAGSEKQREVINMQLQDYPLFLCTSFPARGFLSHLDGLQTTILILLICMIVVVTLFFLFMQMQLLSPLENLSSAFGQIEEGHLDYRLETSSRISEIDRIYQNFNEMMDSLRTAENESQRQRMDALQAKLQYLQLQIRPHFYLNCLKNINSLAAVHKDEEIQELVIYLSDYFRYNFQDVKNFVTVREELEAVQSYVNLCRCLYYTLNLSLDIESAVLQVRCLPMTILTFVENCIKHGGDIHNLEIWISAFLRMNDDEEPEAVIEVRNSGAFPEETLQELNGSSVQEVSYGRDQVGIKNVRYRLYLIYGDRAYIRFLNEPQYAVVQTVFPVEQNDSSGE